MTSAGGIHVAIRSIALVEAFCGSIVSAFQHKVYVGHGFCAGNPGCGMLCFYSVYLALFMWVCPYRRHLCYAFENVISYWLHLGVSVQCSKFLWNWVMYSGLK